MLKLSTNINLRVSLSRRYLAMLYSIGLDQRLHIRLRCIKTAPPRQRFDSFPFLSWQAQ
jgi:hypothetical protein